VFKVQECDVTVYSRILPSRLSPPAVKPYDHAWSLNAPVRRYREEDRDRDQDRDTDVLTDAVNRTPETNATDEPEEPGESDEPTGGSLRTRQHDLDVSRVTLEEEKNLSHRWRPSAHFLHPSVSRCTE
jgi:hypothetical protein